jgi:hypothetical protein
MIRSGSLSKSTLKDFLEIQFVFFRVILYFRSLYEFLKFKQKWKNWKTQRTMLGLNSARGLALLAQPNGYFSLVGPTTRRVHDHYGGVTGTGSPAAPVWWGRCGWGLTEATGRWWGGGGSGEQRRSEAAGKLRWPTVVVEGTCSIKGARGMRGAKPFGQKGLEEALTEDGGRWRCWLQCSGDSIGLRGGPATPWEEDKGVGWLESQGV